MPQWQQIAAEKRASLAAAIPEKWRLSSIPSAQAQPDMTGAYIQQFLTPREIEITEKDAADILSKTTTGAWTAVEVTEAFCHRAALAQQLVRLVAPVALAEAPTDDLPGELSPRDIL